MVGISVLNSNNFENQNGSGVRVQLETGLTCAQGPPYNGVNSTLLWDAY